MTGRRNLGRKMKCKDPDFLVQEYIKNNKSATQIADELGVHSSSIYRYLKKYNIKKDIQNIQNDRCEKQKKILLNKYGVEYPSQIPGSSEKAKATNLKKYGASVFINSEKGVKKKKETSILKYGVEHPTKTEEIRAKMKETMRRRHGVSHPLQSSIFQEKRKNTMVSRYGYDGVLNNPEMRKKFEEVMREKYGFISIAQTPSGMNKIIETKIASGYISTINGKLKTELAEQYSIPYSTLTNIARTTNLSLEQIIKNYECSGTSLEKIASEKLNINRYNKYFDLQLYPNLKYRPDFKLTEKSALNVDGLYWHSELNKHKKYHFEMREQYEKLGLRVFQFRDDEIRNKSEIIFSIINNHLGNSVKIGARKTKIVHLSNKDATGFYEQNQIGRAHV